MTVRAAAAMAAVVVVWMASLAHGARLRLEQAQVGLSSAEQAAQQVQFGTAGDAEGGAPAAFALGNNQQGAPPMMARPGELSYKQVPMYTGMTPMIAGPPGGQYQQPSMDRPGGRSYQQVRDQQVREMMTPYMRYPPPSQQNNQAQPGYAPPGGYQPQPPRG
jgi:hypothetical protein